MDLANSASLQKVESDASGGFDHRSSCEMISPCLFHPFKHSSRRCSATGCIKLHFLNFATFLPSPPSPKKCFRPALADTKSLPALGHLSEMRVRVLFTSVAGQLNLQLTWQWQNQNEQTETWMEEGKAEDKDFQRQRRTGCNCNFQNGNRKQRLTVWQRHQWSRKEVVVAVACRKMLRLRCYGCCA